MASEPINLLFVCSRNQWRSPTGERMYARHPGVNTRSVGTNVSARRRVTAKDIAWADVVLVMEDKHKQRLLTEFPAQMKCKETHVLGIEDHYRFMDDELVQMIASIVDPIIDSL